MGFFEERKKELINQLTSDFFKYMLQEVNHAEYDKPRSGVIHHMGDYLLILMYQYRCDDDRLCELLEQVVEFYKKTKDRVGTSDSRWVYEYLKLCGCIINQYDNLANTQQLIEEELVDDFYDTDYSGRAIIPPHRELGYPTGRGHEIKSLSSNQIWTGYREAVESEFYEDIIGRCRSYHEHLKDCCSSK